MAIGIIEFPPDVWRPDPTLPARLKFTAQNDPYLVFSQTVIEKVYRSFRLPINFVSNPLTVIDWSNSTTSVLNVVWQIAVWKITPNVDIDDVIGAATFDTANIAAADAGVGTRELQEIQLALANFDSAIAGDRVLMQLFRDGGNAGDTMAEDAFFFGLTLEYTAS